MAVNFMMLRVMCTNLRFFTTELHGVARSFKILVLSSVKLRVLRGYILPNLLHMEEL